MKGGSLSFAIRTPFAKPNAMPTNSVRTIERVAAQQRRAHHDRAERQVDAAGDDDERHAEGHEADIIAGFENILDRIERQEVIAED